jgi:hypothetical protein
MTGPDDGPLLVPLRRALDDAVARVDHGLADRLLTGARARRQARRTRGAALAVLLLVGLTAGGFRLLSGYGADELTVAEPSVEGPAVAVLTAKAVSREQAARSGLDGSSQCESPAVRAPDAGWGGAGPELTVVAGYLTDERGLRSWSREYTGTYSSEEPAGPGGLVAVCWFSGPVPADSSGGAPVEGTSLLLVVTLADPSLGMGQRVQSVDPLPVLAPPAPAPELLTGDLAAAATVVHAQPAGVAVVDVLVRPSPPAPTEDCAPVGCPTSEELPVRLDVLLEGRPVPLMERQSARPGEVLQVEVTVDVPAGAELTGLVFGASGEGSRIEQVLAEAPRQGPGPVTYRLDWTVAGAPGGLAQLRVEYTQAVTPDGVGTGGIVNRPFVLLDVQ